MDQPRASDPDAPALPQPGPDEVSLLIDGRPVVVKKGTTVLQAAAGMGITIPHYCYHPGLSIAGNCRMCLVEIEKVPKLQIGCATNATQGMSVRTDTPRVVGSREGIMEFLLINHPLDCPICDQAGECRLQEYSALHGQAYSRFQDEKVHFPKRGPIGRDVTFDAERCIKCTRCIRFCDEISKSHELGLFQRGDHAIIGTFPGKPLDNPYSGCTVDVCPVGALTWTPFRFRARVWFLKNTPSICVACARGCNVDVAVYKNRIQRLTPRENMEVNRWWMCDAGRSSHEALVSRPRLDAPRVRGEDGTPRTAPWEEAIDRAADLLRSVASRHGEKSTAAIVSARLSVEDLHVARSVLGDALKIPRLAVPPHEEGEDDHLLIRRDRTPNARGAALTGIGRPDAGRVLEIAQDLAAGRVRGLVVVGEDPIADGLLDASSLETIEALVVVDSWDGPTAKAAHAALPARAWSEAEGVYVNCDGRAQRARAALKPSNESEPVWSILSELGRRFGLSANYDSASSVFDDLAARQPAFAGLSYRSIGRGGVPVKER